MFRGNGWVTRPLLYTSRWAKGYCHDIYGGTTLISCSAKIGVYFTKSILLYTGRWVKGYCHDNASMSRENRNPGKHLLIGVN